MSSAAPVIGSSGAIIPNCFQLGDEPRAPAPAAAHAPTTATQAVEPTKDTTAAVQPKRSTADVVDLKQVLRQLKDRLRVVDREIKTRKTLEKERDQIRRLISAAQQEQSNLRRMRAAG